MKLIYLIFFLLVATGLPLKVFAGSPVMNNVKIQVVNYSSQSKCDRIYEILKTFIICNEGKFSFCLSEDDACRRDVDKCSYADIISIIDRVNSKLLDKGESADISKFYLIQDEYFYNYVKNNSSSNSFLSDQSSFYILRHFLKEENGMFYYDITESKAGELGISSSQFQNHSSRLSYINKNHKNDLSLDSLTREQWRDANMITKIAKINTGYNSSF